MAPIQVQQKYIINGVKRLRENYYACAKDLSQKEIVNLVNKLDIDDINFLLNDWCLNARPEQISFSLDDCDGKKLENWRTWLVIGGRGSGKTRTGSEWIHAQAIGKQPMAEKSVPAKSIGLIGETFADVRDVMIEGESGILSIAPLAERPEFIASRRLLLWPNGCKGIILSADDPQSIRGLQFSAVWGDELCKWRYARKCWDMLQFTLRLSENPKILLTTTPKPMPLLQEIKQSKLTKNSHMKTDDNSSNLPHVFMQNIHERYDGTRLGHQEIEGIILADDQESLFNRHIIEKNRCYKLPTLTHKVIAVDPPARSHSHSSACGIVVAGIAENKHIYIIEDATCIQVKPVEWSQACIASYHKHAANHLLVEDNQGGEMVESIIKQFDSTVNFHPVNARKNKWMRAEPVASLYERGVVHHVGYYSKLEDEMCGFTQNFYNKKSPDRLDALVWAVDFLTRYQENKEPKIRQLLA